MAKRPKKRDQKVDRRALLRLRGDLRWLQGNADPDKEDKSVPQSSNVLIGGDQPPALAPEWITDFDPANSWRRPNERSATKDDEEIHDLREAFDRRRRIWSACHHTLPRELLFDVREPIWRLLRPAIERALVWIEETIGSAPPTAEEVGIRRFRAERDGDDRHAFVVGDGLLDDSYYGPRKIGDLGWGIAIVLMHLPRGTIGLSDLVAKIDSARSTRIDDLRSARSHADASEVDAGDKQTGVSGTVPGGLLRDRTSDEWYPAIRNNWRMLITDAGWRDRWFTFNKQERTVVIHDQPKLDH